MSGVPPGRLVILNGVQRSGKSSIAHVIQATFPGVWMNIGVDAHIGCTPTAYRPGIGLRAQRPGWSTDVPGRVPLHVLEHHVPVFFAALYESVAAHARLGLNVVVDVGHHDAYTRPLGILPDCARRLSGLPVLFVGVRCPVDVLWERREATWGRSPDDVDPSVIASVELSVEAVHTHGGYDLEVDTSALSPAGCAELIRERLRDGPPGSRFAEIAQE